MNAIRKGEVYQAAKKRSGKTEKTDWEMISVVDEKGHNAISVFVANRPSGIEEGEHFRVDDISGVSVKSRKDDKGNWWTDVSVNAEVTSVQGLNQYIQKISESMQEQRAG